MPKKKITALNEEFDFKLFVTIAKKNFLWFAFFLTISIFSSFIYLRYTPPVYEVSAVIKLSQENDANKILNLNANGFKDLSINQMAGDIELIRSRIIVERAVAKLPLNISYYSKGTLLEFELYNLCPFTVESVPLDSEIFGTQFFVEFNNKFEYTLSYVNNKNEAKK